MVSPEVADRLVTTDPEIPEPVTPDPAPVSRAGRNLPAAITVGLSLGALVVASLFVRREIFVPLATASVCIGVWEISRALRRGGVVVPVVPALVGTVGMNVAAFVGVGRRSPSPSV